MSWRQHRFGLGLAAVGAVVALGMVSCTDRLLVTPARTVPLHLALAVMPAAATAGVNADACAKTNGAHVRLLDGDRAALDTTVAVAAPCDHPIDLQLVAPSDMGSFQLLVVLLADGQAVFEGSTAIKLARGQRTDAPVTVAPVPAGIAAPDSLRTFTRLGDSLQLGGAVVFATGDTVEGAAVSWADDGQGIVRVANGLVRSVAEGSAVLTASYPGVTHTTRVSVRAVVASISTVGVSDTATLLVGAMHTFTAVARDSGGNALQRTITWASSDPAVATVDAGGTVQALAPGTSVISASAGGQTGSFTLTVLLVPVARVAVTPGSASLAIGRTVQLTATTFDAAGSVLTGRAVTWSSSNTRVASVSSAGLVSALSGGTATITATSEGVSGSAGITVFQPILQVIPSFIADTTDNGVAAAALLSVRNGGTGPLDGLTATVTYPTIPGTVPAQIITSATLDATSAPATLTVQLSNQYTCGTYNATVTVASTTPGSTPVPVPVTYVIVNCLFSNPAPIQSVGPAPGSAVQPGGRP